MASPDLLVAAATGAVCLAIAATLWALAVRRDADRQILGYRSRLDRLEGLADATQASAEAFDSAMITIEGGAPRLAWGGDTLRLCAEVLGLSAAEDRYCQLREVVAEPPPRGAKASTPLRPSYRDGRRWPTPRARPQTVWRLSISYWQVLAEASVEPPAPSEPAAAVRARLERPLRPVNPQQPHDIGLFEFRPPDAPHIVMPDE